MLLKHGQEPEGQLFFVGLQLPKHEISPAVLILVSYLLTSLPGLEIILVLTTS